MSPSSLQQQCECVCLTFDLCLSTVTIRSLPPPRHLPLSFHRRDRWDSLTAPPTLLPWQRHCTQLLLLVTKVTNVFFCSLDPDKNRENKLQFFLPAGGAAALSRPYSPSPPPPPPANYVPSPSRPGGHAPPSAAAAPPLPTVMDGRKPPGGPNVPMNDARSDLLAAIRRGQLVTVSNTL